MSGGAFDYNQYKISEMADHIESEIARSGRKKTVDELKYDYPWRDKDWYETHPEDLCYHKYSDEVIKEFKEAVTLLRKAHIYTHRVDWLLSGDDGEETFLERLKEDIEALNK